MHYFKLLGHLDSYKELWENREALDKYLARLKELMEEDEKQKEEVAALDLGSTKPCSGKS